MGLTRSLAWGAAFAAGGLVVALGWMPGASTWATGPRIGVATLLMVLGCTVVALSAVPWILRRTTRPADYKGGCPVGASCACGQFNFKPRKECRSCGKATLYPS